MEPETINMTTGIVSALMAILSTALILIGKIGLSASSKRINNKYIRTILVLILSSSGWALSCLCYLWIFEPFGIYPSKWDYKKLYGIILAYPSLVILYFGTKMLILPDRNNKD